MYNLCSYPLNSIVMMDENLSGYVKCSFLDIHLCVEINIYCIICIFLKINEKLLQVRYAWLYQI